jgi:alpha-D-ribose 1-methylphosphonate 5-triphosphate diphosphatase
MAFKSLECVGISDLAKAVRMVSLHPAKAMGIDKEIGTIEAGKMADLIMAEEIGGIPVVVKTMVGGRVVFSAGNHLNASDLCPVSSSA